MYNRISTSKGYIKYRVQYKNVKNVTLRIENIDVCLVTCPITYPLDKIEKIVLDYSDKLHSKINANKNILENYFMNNKLFFLGREYTYNLVKAKRNSVVVKNGIITFNLTSLDFSQLEKAIDRLYLSYSSRYMNDIFLEVLDEIKISNIKKEDKDKIIGKDIKIEYKKVKSYWGKCIIKEDTIVINSRLLAFPKDVIKSVFFHELAHFLASGHGKYFYQKLYKLYPEYDKHNHILSNSIISNFIRLLFNK